MRYDLDKVKMCLLPNEYVVEIGDYAFFDCVVDSDDRDVGVNMMNINSGYNGKGKGDVKALRIAFEEVKRIARSKRAVKLSCTLYVGDGREGTRRKVYTKAGFVADTYDDRHMTCNLIRCIVDYPITSVEVEDCRDLLQKIKYEKIFDKSKMKKFFIVSHEAHKEDILEVSSQYRALLLANKG